MADYTFDASRAWLAGPDQFKRYRVPNAGRPLLELGWPPSTDVLVLERGGSRLAFRADQMTYHHLAQGKLAGQPYLVSF